MSAPFNLPPGCAASDIEGDDAEERERKYQIELEKADHEMDMERSTE